MDAGRSGGVRGVGGGVGGGGGVVMSGSGPPENWASRSGDMRRGFVDGDEDERVAVCVCVCVCVCLCVYVCIHIYIYTHRGGKGRQLLGPDWRGDGGGRGRASQVGKVGKGRGL